MAQQQHNEVLYKEGRMALAINTLQTGQILTSTEAAASYNVSRKTLTRRLASIQPQHGSRAYNRLLTINKEESLV
jgi:hypothetical protein